MLRSGDMIALQTWLPVLFVHLVFLFRTTIPNEIGCSSTDLFSISLPVNNSRFFTSDLSLSLRISDALANEASNGADLKACVAFRLPGRREEWSPFTCEDEHLLRPALLPTSDGFSALIPNKFVLQEVPVGAVQVRAALQRGGLNIAVTAPSAFERSKPSVMIASPANGAVLASATEVWLEGFVFGFVPGRDGLICVHVAGFVSACVGDLHAQFLADGSLPYRLSLSESSLNEGRNAVRVMLVAHQAPHEVFAMSEAVSFAVVRGYVESDPTIALLQQDESPVRVKQCRHGQMAYLLDDAYVFAATCHT